MNRCVFAQVSLACFAILSTSACAPQDERGPLAFCTGTYTCTLGAESVDAMPMREGDHCRMGELVLDVDGSVHDSAGPLISYDWVVLSSGELQICDDESCLVCVPPEGSRAAPTPATRVGGRCTGSRSCSSVSPGSCSSIDGCSLNLGSTLDDDDDSCEGYPRSCDAYDSQSACVVEYGCYWRE